MPSLSFSAPRLLASLCMYMYMYMYMYMCVYMYIEFVYVYVQICLETLPISLRV